MQSRLTTDHSISCISFASVHNGGRIIALGVRLEKGKRLRIAATHSRAFCIPLNSQQHPELYVPRDPPRDRPADYAGESAAPPQRHARGSNEWRPGRRRVPLSPSHIDPGRRGSRRSAQLRQDLQRSTPVLELHQARVQQVQRAPRVSAR